MSKATGGRILGAPDASKNCPYDRDIFVMCSQNVESCFQAALAVKLNNTYDALLLNAAMFLEQLLVESDRDFGLAHVMRLSSCVRPLYMCFSDVLLTYDGVGTTEIQRKADWVFTDHQLFLLQLCLFVVFVCWVS